MSFQNWILFGKLSLKIISAFRFFHIKDLLSTPIFADPTCLYQTFVDFYQRKKGKYIAKQEITKRIANLWSKIKNDKNEMQRYIDSAPVIIKDETKTYN